MEHQHVMKLHDLMTCQRFEIIECFLHVVTPNEEEAAFGDRLRKLRPFMEHLKSNCFILSATPAIGTLCTNCVGVPTSVVDVKRVLDHAVGRLWNRILHLYALHPLLVFTCVRGMYATISTACLGHSEGTVMRRVKGGKVTVTCTTCSGKI